MKNAAYIVLVLILLLAGCKKNNNGAEIDPEPTGAVTAAEFLKDLQVTGAESIRFDSANNSYLVNLPDGFDQEKAEVRLALQSNIVLEYDLDKSSAADRIRYDYRGTSPLNFTLRRKSGNRAYKFQVFFRFSGVPQIDLLEKQVNVNPYYTQLDMRYGKNVGSIPAGPDRRRTAVRITNNKTGKIVKASFEDQFGVMYIEDDYNLITDELTNVEVKLEGQQPVIFEGVKFINGKAIVYPNPSYKYQFLYSDTIKIYGDNFVPARKYTVQFSNDFMAAPIVAPAHIVDGWLHVDKIPADLPEGSYLLSFFEANRFIGNSSFHVSSHETDAIESLWKGDLYGATYRNMSPLSVSRGESFFVKSSPLIYGYGNSQLDVNKLPRLRLILNGAITELNPELVIFHWGIAGISLGVGQFKIPADLPPGNYDVRGLFVNNSESKPYWSKLQVK